MRYTKQQRKRLLCKVSTVEEGNNRFKGGQFEEKQGAEGGLFK